MLQVAAVIDAVHAERADDMYVAPANTHHTTPTEGG